MTSIIIDDVGDYLTDEEVKELAEDRGFRVHKAGDRGIAGDQAVTSEELWKRLADAIREAAHAGDRTHMEVLLLRMLRYADIDQPPPGFVPSHLSAIATLPLKSGTVAR